MEKKLEMLHKLCEALADELEEYSKKIEKADKMSAGDLEAVDKLSHALKSIKTTIAMMEADGSDGGYSGRYMPYWGGMSYGDGNSYAQGGRGGQGGGSRGGQGGSRGGSSYARGGRGRMNNNPTGRNQYSRDGGYSYAEGEMQEIIDNIRDMMDDLPDEKRRKVERLVNELDM